MNINLIFSIVFSGIGVVLLAWGVYLYFRQRACLARSLTAEGEIVELLQQQVAGKYVRVKTAAGIRLEKKVRYRPVVRFQTQAGRVVEFSPSIAMRPAPFQVGERVRVLYNPADPHQAQIDRFVFVWFGVIMLLLFGVFTLGMGIIGILLQVG